MKHIRVLIVVVALFTISGCGQAAPVPPPAMAVPTIIVEDVPVPAGWVSDAGQKCVYSVSHPSEMEVTEQNPYSRTFGFKLADPDAVARNFVYVSVISPEIQDMVRQGSYQGDVYNYDPVATNLLLGMQVGESKSVHQNPDLSGFTYLRQPDTTLGGHTAMAFENFQPWEFPVGTKEIRYYLPVDGCTYLLGGYVDVTGSNKAGTITEDLFRQIAGTFRVME